MRPWSIYKVTDLWKELFEVVKAVTYSLDHLRFHWLDVVEELVGMKSLVGSTAPHRIDCSSSSGSTAVDSELTAALFKFPPVTEL